MSAYERYCEIRDSLGFKDADVVKKTGIGKSTFSDWKSGRYTPKDEKMHKIAEALGTTAEYIRYGVKEEFSTPEPKSLENVNISNVPGSCLDPETARIVQEVFEDPNMRILFEAARGSKPDDIKMAADMLNRFKSTNPDG